MPQKEVDAAVIEGKVVQGVITAKGLGKGISWW